MTVTMFHAPEGPRSALLQRDEEGRARAILWNRETDDFDPRDWQDDAGDAALLAQAGAGDFTPAPEAPHNAPGDERVIGVGGTCLFGTLVHCACHREWDLLKDFSR